MTYNGVQPLKVNRLSLSEQAQRYLFDLIEDGIYEPGQQLPSEHQLAAQLGISRPTLREALLNLEQEGVVIRRHGVGTFVAPGFVHRLEGGLERLESILDLAAQQEMQVKVKSLEVNQQPADRELAEKLQVARGTALTVVRRVLVVDGAPAAYMSDVVPSSILSPNDVDGTFRGSVLDVLRQKQDLHVTQAVANIGAINADSLLAQKLGVSVERAVLLLEETLFNDAGTIVEYSCNYFVPDLFRFHVVRR